MHDHIWHKAAGYAARQLSRDPAGGGEPPSLVHASRVATVLTCLFGCRDETAIAAAYLHHVLTETAAGYDDIERAFGKDVADMVAALTKNTALPIEECNADFRSRLAAASWKTRIVKLADLYDDYIEALQTADSSLVTQSRCCQEVLPLCEADAREHGEMKRAVSLLKDLIYFRYPARHSQG